MSAPSLSPSFLLFVSMFLCSFVCVCSFVCLFWFLCFGFLVCSFVFVSLFVPLFVLVSLFVPLFVCLFVSSSYLLPIYSVYLPLFPPILFPFLDLFFQSFLILSLSFSRCQSVEIQKDFLDAQRIIKRYEGLPSEPEKVGNEILSVK